MSTRGSTWYDEDRPIMQWYVEARKCPFDELPARICGCPEGERIMDEEAHIVRGTE